MGDLLYPSCVVNFRLRFDETFRVTDIPEPGPQGGDPTAVAVPASGPPTDTGTRARRQPVVSIGEAYKETQPGDFAPNTRPLVTQAGASNLSVVANRIPKSASVELPGYRQAGKFSLEFDWRELPIDPRLIRSAGVEIFMGSVSPSNFGRGMTKVNADGSRSSILSEMPDDLMVLAGIADSWYTSHTDSGSTVRIEGRDLRGLFLDSPADPAVLNKLDLTQPINLVVKAILEKHPAGQLMQVIVHPQDWVDQFIPPVLDSEGLTRVRRTASGGGATADTAGDDVSFWDIITRYCFLVGAIPFFRGRNIVIRPSGAVHDASKPWFDPLDRTFQSGDRVDDDGNPFSERKMVFGRNIKELTFERKLSGTKVPVVEIISFDTSSDARGGRKLLIEQWPPKDEKLARVSGVLPSGEVSQTDKIKIPVAGIRDRNKLLGIAKAVYEEVGRGELGGSCKTGALASFKGDNADPDLLRLRPGDPVHIVVDSRGLSSKAPAVSALTDAHRRSFADQVREVQQALAGKTQGGDENLARVIVASARSMVIELLGPFRTSNVVFNWSASAGVQISFDFQNYFSPRYGVNEQLGKNIAPVEAVTARSDKAKRPKERVRPQPKMKSKPRRPAVTIGKATGG